MRLGLPWRAVPLEDEAALASALSGVAFVLHCAGPFSHTWSPMVRACLRAGCHYLDINGELPVFEAIARLAPEARRAGIMLLPGMGFDVVPTDCLAAHLKRRLPGARRLTLGFAMTAGPSRGTAAVMLEMVQQGLGAIRQEGLLRQVPFGWKARMFDFGDGQPRRAVTVPWGDLCTAFRSTGIPNIEVYGAYPTALQAILQNLLRSDTRGPSPEELARGQSLFVGEVEDGSGRMVSCRLIAPNPYTLTARSAVQAALHVLRGRVRPGFQTPSLALGAEFALEIEGVSRHDLA